MFDPEYLPVSLIDKTENYNGATEDLPEIKEVKLKINFIGIYTPTGSKPYELGKSKKANIIGSIVRIIEREKYFTLD